MSNPVNCGGGGGSVMSVTTRTENHYSKVPKDANGSNYVQSATSLLGTT